MNLTKLALLQLCYADYESLELSLAAVTKFTNPQIHLFLLQNGRGTYDTERTYRVCKRYEALFPERITVIDWLKPDAPYYSIKKLLNSPVMQDYDYICKIDDDVFPLTPNWLEALFQCYDDSVKQYGDTLGYVTSLVNNNPWGFIQTLSHLHLQQEFDRTIARTHRVGAADKTRIIAKGDLAAGMFGSVITTPVFARYIHHQTTLKPDFFIKGVENLAYTEVDASERYSINCMVFNKNFWNQIGGNSSDDEHLAYEYCKRQNKKIIANLAVPMVHLFFYNQREENKDLLPQIRAFYQEYWQLNYPISLCPNKLYDLENRLRFLEQKYDKNQQSLNYLRFKNRLKNSFRKHFSYLLAGF